MSEGLLSALSGLEREEQQDSLRRWREGRNEQAYERLFRSLIKLGEKRVKIFTARLSAPRMQELFARRHDDIMNDVVLPAIVRSLEKFDFTKSGGEVKVSTYTTRAIDNALIYFAKVENRRRGEVSLAQPLKKCEDFTLEDVLPAEVESAERAAVISDLRTKVAGLYRAISMTILMDKRESAIVAMRWLPDKEDRMTLGAIGGNEELGDAITVERVRQIEKELRKKFRECFRSNGEEVGLTASEFLLRHFMEGVELKDDDAVSEQFAKMRTAGVDFRDDGYVDLSEAGSNRFNTTVFKMAGGGAKAGISMLQEREARDVHEFFQKVGAKPDLFVGVEEKDDRALTADDVCAAVRDSVNVQTMIDLFGLRVDPDNGKWTVEVGCQEFFDHPWCVLNGRKRGGLKLLCLCGIEGQGQSSIRQFFELVFDKENIHFLEHQMRGGYKERMDIAELTRQIRLNMDENFAELQRYGIHVDGNICYVNVPIKEFENSARLKVGKKWRKAVNIIKRWLGASVSRRIILELCQGIFPDKEIISLMSRHGVRPRKIWRPDTLAKKLRRKKRNLELLRAKTVEQEDGRLLVDLNQYDFRGCFFEIDGQQMGLGATLSKVGRRSPSKENIMWLYEQVFGEDQIIATPQHRGLRKEKAIQLQQPNNA